MRKILGFVLSLGVLVGLSTVTMADHFGGLILHAEMTGAAEPGGGDNDGSGTAAVWPMPGQGRVCFGIRVMNIGLPATGAHIHEGAAGVPGPIVIGLTNPDTTGISRGCVVADPTLLRRIKMNPSNFYVNVHNSSFPDGAIRGQLHL